VEGLYYGLGNPPGDRDLKDFMNLPQNSNPVLVWYNPYGPEEIHCVTVASYMEVGPMGNGRWLIAESQEWLGWPVTTWAPIPEQPRPPDGTTDYALLTAEIGKTCEALYYVKNDIPTGCPIEGREALIVALNQLAFEASDAARVFIACRE
jgi:hypothetical protein